MVIKIIAFLTFPLPSSSCFLKLYRITFVTATAENKNKPFTHIEHRAGAAVDREGLVK